MMADVQSGQGRVMATTSALVIAVLAASLSWLSPMAHAATGHAAMGHASAGKDDAFIDRMTDQLVAMMPIDRILSDASIQRDMLDDSRLDRTQAACMTREMSARRYRAIRRRDVELYAMRHPQRIALDLELLDSGAGTVMARLMRVALEQEKAKRDARAAAGDVESADDDAADGEVAEAQPARPDPADAVLDEASASEVLAMMIFMGDPNYEELRALSGFGAHPFGSPFGAGSPFADLSDSMRLRPFDMIGMSMMKMLLGAAADCKVPPKVLLDRKR